ncbi:MAG: PAS domain-containing protein, partial [Janthinobacterium lividum]
MVKPDNGLGDASPARLFATLLSNMEGMVYRCLADASWTMEFVSDGSMDLTGYSAQDLLHSECTSFEDIIHPQDKAATRKAIFDALRKSPRFSVEYRIVRADGAIRWVWERGTGLYNASGKLEVIEGFIQDISLRVEAEFALREAERSFRSIFENAVEGIFQSTPDHGYLAVNPALARMYGFDHPRQLIDNLRDLNRQLYVDPTRRAEFMRLLDEQESITNFESRVYRRDGEIIWVSENARAVRDPEGSLLFYEGTVECITERKMYEAKIRFQATHDPLTGLPNRTLLHDRMQQAMLHAQRQGCLAALIFVDLDHF